MAAELLWVPPLIDIGSQIAAHSPERTHLHLLRLASRWWREAVDASPEAWRALCERELGPLLAPTLLSHVESFGPRSSRQLLDSKQLLLELLLRWDPTLLPSSNNLVGLLIGPRGSTIKGIQNESGAQIEIVRGGTLAPDSFCGLAPDVGAAPDSLHAVRVRGAPRSVAACQALIEQLYQHPVELKLSECKLVG